MLKPQSLHHLKAANVPFIFIYDMIIIINERYFISAPPARADPPVVQPIMAMWPVCGKMFKNKGDSLSQMVSKITHYIFINVISIQEMMQDPQSPYHLILFTPPLIILYFTFLWPLNYYFSSFDSTSRLTCRPTHYGHVTCVGKCSRIKEILPTNGVQKHTFQNSKCKIYSQKYVRAEISPPFDSWQPPLYFNIWHDHCYQ